MEKGNVKLKETEPHSYSLKSLFSEIKRGVNEKIINNYKIRDPVLTVAGMGTFWYSIMSPNFVILSVGGAVGVVMFIGGSMNLAFELG
jgi:hypothetical protein